MDEEMRVNNPPIQPLVIYDADCDFCRFWIARWRHVTGERVDYISSQEVGGQFPEIPHEHYQKAVQLVNPDGEVFCGAEAVFRAFAHNARRRWALELYQRLPGFAPITEAVYRFIAGHRKFFSALTRWGWGKQPIRPAFFLTRWLFLRLLGVIYLIAFLSLWTQIDGLIGSDGILPADRYLSTVRDQVGLERYLAFPTLCWLNDSDAFLHLLCGGGRVSVVAVNHRRCAGSRANRLVAVLPLAAERRAEFPEFPVGCATVGNRFSRDFFRPAPDSAKNLAGTGAIACRVMDAPLAAVSADVRVRCREVVERRFDMEQPHRAQFPL